MNPEKTTSGAEPTTATKFDGYANLFTGIQAQADKNRGDYFMPDRVIGSGELANMYEQDGICARIVDRVVDDACRTKFHLKGIDESYDFESVESQLEDLNVIGALGDAWKWGRLYGGGLAIMAVNDGVTYDKPLNLRTAKAITGMNVLDSSTCWPREWIPRLGSRHFAEPQYYEVVVPFVGGTMKSIHSSRVIRIDASHVPPSRLLQRGGWAPSVLQRVWREVTQLGKAMGYSANLLNEMSLMVMMIDGFREMVCGSPEGASQARQMLENFKWSADSLHMIGLDKKDDFKEVKRSADGVAILVDRFVEALVRATDMPRLILLGEQPGGLNADAKGEVRAWYDYVASQQQQILTPGINRVLNILFAIRKREGQVVPTEWTIEYESLYPMAPETQATTLASYAQAAATLITAGVCTPLEIRSKLTELDLLKPVDGEVDTSALGTANTEETGTTTVAEIEAPAANTAPVAANNAPEPTAVAELAMNGAQVQALQGLAAAVAAGQLPRGSAIAIVKAAFPSAAAMAELIIPPEPEKLPAAEPGATPAAGVDDEDEEVLEVAAHAPPTGETLMSPKEIGAQLGVGPAAIKAMHARGEIDGWLIGKRFRYSLSQVTQASHRPAANNIALSGGESG